MKRDERQHCIMDVLVADGEVQLEALALRFDVSRMTIHRDLDELEAAGVLRKIRGGATIRSGTRFESDFRFRERQGAEAKAAMARAALELIEPGMTVMINDGSMAAVLGRMVPGKRPLTVITNNVAILEALQGEAGITLIAIGGVYSQKYNAYLGSLAEEALAGLRADLAFLSSPAVAGLEVFHMDDSVARCKRAMIRQADECCLAVNHGRFGQAALYRLAALSEFRHIITDGAPPPEVRAELEGAGLSLTIARAQEAAA
ncbi:DeoR/GlpR family DNA-binding transcription regulator [Histidinibacterium lentulum]|uniref:DeoR/GlpR transcriptional regulator n=1 Tax=Histidinibacterium lentulum TaxID=2480588 RepID=A0A3N2R7S5_9RHOB|nr:DeoR/GlpR family DNA-binding transcription regulator [Histidinibacterium lentulum]ROU03463.1 DeoR/GlpR transcriptional regulator [Histidinibacterium lentulum]